jgi:hypothetical protein
MVLLCTTPPFLCSCAVADEAFLWSHTNTHTHTRTHAHTRTHTHPLLTNHAQELMELHAEQQRKVDLHQQHCSHTTYGNCGRRFASQGNHIASKDAGAMSRLSCAHKSSTSAEPAAGCAQQPGEEGRQEEEGFRHEHYVKQTSSEVSSILPVSQAYQKALHRVHHRLPLRSSSTLSSYSSAHRAGSFPSLCGPPSAVPLEEGCTSQTRDGGSQNSSTEAQRESCSIFEGEQGAAACVLQNEDGSSSSSHDGGGGLNKRSSVLKWGPPSVLCGPPSAAAPEDITVERSLEKLHLAAAARE